VTHPSRADLSDGQKQCLRLVGQHLTSKEIARKLGISHFTVDQRLDSARRKLNAHSRKDAVRIFMAMEQESLSEPLVYEPSDIAAERDVHIQNPPPKGRTGIFAFAASRISVPPIGGKRHHLPKREILVQSLNIAFFSTLVIALVVIILTGTLRLFR
jgi:DNA-binding CsgD family transcriptional regulator